MRLPSATESDCPHILVVDDEQEVREVVTRALEREGYRVSAYDEGPAALRSLDEHDVQLLITDLRMPKQDGLELIQGAKRRRPELGSIVMTAYASTETAVQALRFGVDDFITKPFAIDELRRTVDRVLRARRLITTDQHAFDRVREEADDLRARQQQAEDALENARRDLDLSRKALQRRVQDLEFISELGQLLARETDLERMLGRTVQVLAARFRAHLTRIEVALPDGVHAAEHMTEDGHHSFRLGSDLLARARRDGLELAREEVLGQDGPLEIFAAPLARPQDPAGGVLLVRPCRREDDGTAFLLGLVPQTLGIALEAEIQRRDAVQNTLRVATGMLEALEGRGTLHRGHAERVTFLAERMAEDLGLSSRLRRVIATAARLHDVGAVGIPDAIFHRTDPLRDHERDLLRGLPVLGARILEPFGEAAAFVRHLHERPDGQGFPDRLADPEIPIGAAIIGCAEAYDAMTHHRAWRPTRSKKEALTEILARRGTQFVSDAVDSLHRVVETGVDL